MDFEAWRLKALGGVNAIGTFMARKYYWKQDINCLNPVVRWRFQDCANYRHIVGTSGSSEEAMEHG